jgi:hypothetical protein
MKFSTLITGFLLCALVVIAIVPVHADDIPTVTIGSYTVSPSVLMPGSTGTITISFNNTARSATVTQESGELQSTTYTNIRTNDVNVNIQNVHLEGYGIKVLTGDFNRVGALGPGQSIPLTFEIQAPDTPGLYYPQVWVDTLGGQSTRYPIQVNVDTPVGIQKQAILILASSINGTVSPGDDIPVALTLSNSGQLLADDITLKIANVSTDIAPKYTDTYDIGPLNANESSTINVVLLSDKQANPGLVQVPVMISYKAIDGTPVTQPSSIDMILDGKAELGIVSVDTNPSPLVDSQPFDFTIRIENTGTGDAKQVAATIDVPAEGTKEAFIGKIQPGDDAPALFLIEGMKGGTYPYNLTVTYTDDLGNHTFVRPMTLRVPPADNTGNVVLGLVILAVLAFLAYRYWYLPRKNSDGMFSWAKKN